jgi:signal transduction histidine kinase
VIRSLWLKILALVLVILGPLLGAQYFLQEQSLDVAFGLSERLLPHDALARYQLALKRLARLDPANELEYRREFGEAAEAQGLWEDLSLTRAAVRRDLGYQSLRMALAVIALSALLSFLIARNIAAHFARLLEDNRRQINKLSKLHALEGWQTTARMLVHELKGPLTPLRLVAGELEAKYLALPPERFAAQLSEGTRIMAAQVRVLDGMLESFTRFAKLPEPRPERMDLGQALAEWGEAFRAAAGERATLTYERESLKDPWIEADAGLLQALLRNLVNNAIEANPATPPRVKIRAWQEADLTIIEVANTGVPLPESLTRRLFEPYASTKRETGKTNMGLGLTIGKKIAIDHGGDLLLRSPGGPGAEVVFRVELPSKRPARPEGTT